MWRRDSPWRSAALWRISTYFGTSSFCSSPARQASTASVQRSAHRHQACPPRRIDRRSFPRPALNSSQRSVTIAATVWLPRSYGPVLQYCVLELSRTASTYPVAEEASDRVPATGLQRLAEHVDRAVHADPVKGLVRVGQRAGARRAVRDRPGRHNYAGRARSGKQTPSRRDAACQPTRKHK